MKDFTKEELELARPMKDLLYSINFCLDALYKDEDHEIKDRVCTCLTYEEVIGTLLLAKDSIEKK